MSTILTDVHARLAEVEQERDLLRSQVISLRANLDACRARIGRACGKIGRLTAERDELRLTLAAEVRRLRAELDSANAAVDAAFAERDQYMQGQTEAIAIARDLRAELTEARATLAADQNLNPREK